MSYIAVASLKLYKDKVSATAEKSVVWAALSSTDPRGVLVTVVVPSELVVVVSLYLCPLITTIVVVSSSSSSEEPPAPPPAETPLAAPLVEVSSVAALAKALPAVSASSESSFSLSAFACLI
jgi:hypothetical protein